MMWKYDFLSVPPVDPGTEGICSEFSFPEGPVLVFPGLPQRSVFHVTKGKYSLRIHTSSLWTILWISSLPNSLDEWPKALKCLQGSLSQSLCSEGQIVMLSRSKVGWPRGMLASIVVNESEANDGAGGRREKSGPRAKGWLSPYYHPSSLEFQ